MGLGGEKPFERCHSEENSPVAQWVETPNTKGKNTQPDYQPAGVSFLLGTHRNTVRGNRDEKGNA